MSGYYVVCFSCGTSIGQYMEIVDIVRKEKYRAFCETNKLEYKPEHAFSIKMDLDLGILFDELGVRHECCRRLLLTQEPFGKVV